MALSAALLLGGIASAQKVDFEEYTLENGLHVILHNDPSAPVVVTSVMYHVGAKDENPERTGFAHFFEHLLFEGTQNIKKGEWFKIVSSNGGNNNANTTEDRTYYYEVFPSNNLELGLWMESERMMHPIINQIGVDTQNEVVKEEKRTSFDNRPYGNFQMVVKNELKDRVGSKCAISQSRAANFSGFQSYTANISLAASKGDLDSRFKTSIALLAPARIAVGTPPLHSAH